MLSYMSALILKMIKKGESIWLGIDQPPNPFKKYGPEKRATDSYYWGLKTPSSVGAQLLFNMKKVKFMIS